MDQIATCLRLGVEHWNAKNPISLGKMILENIAMPADLPAGKKKRL